MKDAYWQNQDRSSALGDEPHACFCVGPQDGQPLCPCAMKGVRIENGRYIQIIDHGPVKG